MDSPGPSRVPAAIFQPPAWSTECDTGSDKSESFHPGGGHDRVTTGGGADTVFFDDRAGKRDVLTITDFDPLADTRDLRGVTVEEMIECRSRTVLHLRRP